MTDKSPRYFPRNDKPASTPEIQPPVGDVPKKFPEPQPLSDDGLEAAKKGSTDTMSPPAEHSGEDDTVEAGIDQNDPEQSHSAAGDEPME